MSLTLTPLKNSFVALALVLSAGCYSPYRLAPGEALSLNLALKPGAAQMIEIDAVGLEEAGSEITLAIDEVQLPPVYLGIFGPVNSRPRTAPGKQSIFSSSGSNQPSERALFSALLWSPHWPLAPDAQVKLSNYGPGSITLTRVSTRGGLPEKLYKRAAAEAPFPLPTRNEVQSLLTDTPIIGVEDPRAISQISSVSGWLAQMRRRITFERIDGLPLAFRLAEKIKGDIQIKGRQLGGGAAVVAVSRPGFTSWQALGPGWSPPQQEATWQPLPSGNRYLPRTFTVVGSLHTIAVFLAAPIDERGRTVGSVAAKLYKLDSPTPLVTTEWHDIGPDGRWVEMNFPDGPQPPGDYVLELRTTAGNPQWLVWSRVREPIPGTDLTKPIETLLVQQSPAEVKYDQRLGMKLMVAGRASTIDHYKGLEADPKKENPQTTGAEMTLEASLLPGETEVFLLRDYLP